MSTIASSEFLRVPELDVFITNCRFLSREPVVYRQTDRHDVHVVPALNLKCAVIYSAGGARKATRWSRSVQCRCVDAKRSKTTQNMCTCFLFVFPFLDFTFFLGMDGKERSTLKLVLHILGC